LSPPSRAGLRLSGSGGSGGVRAPRSPVRTPEAYDKKVRTLKILQQFREEEARATLRSHDQDEDDEGDGASIGDAFY
jgi:hypothetical protein